MVNYNTEREGQIVFFETFLPLIDSNISLEEILNDNNDGVLKGNLLEFKLRINDLNSVLFQCIKYLSALRIKGKPVPNNIIIIDLNFEQAYLYKSVDYLKEIEKIYEGSASKENTGFTGNPYLKKYSYGRNSFDASKLIDCLKQNKFTKINIDENCIVGWATSFYNLMPTSRKEDFIGDDTGKHKTIGEIRNPSVFADYIYKYTGKTNIKFQYLMDKLNDTLQKKNLGAFYTPELYAKKSHELLRMAIKRVPAGNDYIIIDRCAGTGNLQKDLTKEELSHCILSTIEYYEYKVMQEVLGSKVRHIIPPVEIDDTFQAGMVKGANALSEEFIKNPIIKQYIDDPNCTIILFENPPYSETTSFEHKKMQASKQSSTWKKSFVSLEMKKDKKGVVLNDLANLFIWSAFKYYLRQSTDSYIVYSPVKYWKSQHLIDKEFFAGFAFNRRHFHTNIDACIMVALWGNKNCTNETLKLQGFNIETDGNLSKPITIIVKKIHNLYSAKYYDKRGFIDTNFDGIITGLNGLEAKDNVKKRVKTFYSKGMLGYMVATGTGFDNPDAKSGLVIAGRYDGNGFYIHKDNYLSKLPMFCASRYITYNRNWSERSCIMKSADGFDLFNTDLTSGKLNQWLLKCLLFTCVEMQNHMRTFTGSDGRFYRNELCLDTTNGQTIATKDLKNLICTKDEKQIIKQYNILLKETKKTIEYNKNITYGVYQIFSEINTSYIDENNNKVYNNIEVNSELRTLKVLVKDYYNKNIVPNLFKYEFLK